MLSSCTLFPRDGFFIKFLIILKRVINDSVDSQPLWVTLDNSSMQILGYALKNCVWNRLSISCQLMIEFLGNVAYKVKAAFVNELGNNLSLG